MSRLPLSRLALLTSGLAAFALVPSFASCAATDEADTSKDDASVVLVPDGSQNDGGLDGDADGGAVLSCDEAAWCPVANPVSSLYALTSVWGSGPEDVWAVGSGGTIIHWDGASWVATDVGVRNTFQAVWGSGPNDVHAVSMTDVLFHSSGFAAGGTSWTRSPTAQAEPNDAFPRAVLAVWGSGANDVRLGIRPRTVLDENGDIVTLNRFLKTTSADGGIVWQRELGAGTVHAIWGSSASDVWLVADDSELNGWQKGITMHGTRAADAGSDAGDAGSALTWASVDSQSTVVLEGLWGSGPGDVWAVGDQGTLRHFTNGAARWAIVPSPTTEALHAVWGSAANDVWAVGDHGTILHHDGTTWTHSTIALPPGAAPSLRGIWGSGPDDVWIVGDDVVLHSTGKASR